MIELQKLLERAERTATNLTARCKVQEIQFPPGYAERGYSTHRENGFIATGNWNDESRWDEKTRKSITLDNTLPRLAKILERMGAELEWSDEWATCEECQNIFRISGDSYGWTPSGTVSDYGGGSSLCTDCIDGADYLEFLECQPTTALNLDIDPDDYNYTELDLEFKNGLYGGQSADPSKIAETLNAVGGCRYLFCIDDVGQFDIGFSVWIHNDSTHKPADYLKALETGETNGPDPVDALKRGFKAADIGMAKLPDGGIKYADIQADGTAKVRIITPQEFIDGSWLKDK